MNKIEETSKTESKHGKILQMAFEIVNGARQNSYGKPEDSFQRIADKWNDYLKLENNNSRITPYEVAYMMALMKLARIEGGNYVQDSFIDACGYLAIASDMKRAMNKE